MTEQIKTEFKKSFNYKLIYVFKMDYESHKGLVKVGDATVEKIDSIEELKDNSEILNKYAKKRINEYTRTAGLEFELLYTTLAVDNKGEGFRDHKVHRVLINSGISKHNFGNETNPQEWFKTDLKTVKNAINAVKSGYSSLTRDLVTDEYEEIVFRPEQKEAIKSTLDRFKTSNAFLWNAKMRFGKTLSALEVIRKMSIDEIFSLNKAIIITHRPVVNDSWFTDYRKIFYNNSDFLYGDKNSQSISELEETGKNYIYFASIQDLRGSEIVGGKFDKNDEVFDIEWDLVVVDEAHEGTLTQLGKNVTEELVKNESGKITRELHLSGTPFNLLDNFEEKDIFTWDYIAEQKAKLDWEANHPLEPNPYDELPRLNIFTYNLDKHLPAYMENSDSAFNFREFFRVWTGDRVKDRKPIPTGAKIGDFVHENDIKKFLDMLALESESGYPYSKKEYRDNFRHSLWIIPGVSEAKALSKMLKSHSVFKMFNIANVAGDGDDDDKEEDLNKVRNAITKEPLNNYSITLSCGKLTTGVTVPEWNAVLYLAGSYQTRATSYLQTIFRVQSPANIKGQVKTDCYVFDFAPDRALKMVAEAGDLSINAGATSSKKKMEDFLNYCSIISVTGSNMQEYNVDNMLQQLKKAYVERVVESGFDDSKIYNDRLFDLDGEELEKFDSLRKIIGSSKQTKKTKDMPMNDQGFDDEKWQRENEKKKKRELTEEEKKRLEELKLKKKQRQTAISILRGISIRIPLLIYGSNYSSDKEITIDNITDNEIVDDESWEEFMPKGITKEKFKEFKEYYDKDIFVGAGNKIRRLAKYCDELPPEERIKEITELFKTFKNPDKETVLTPWRVVNMHMSDTIGGYVFYDKNFKEEVENPRFVTQEEVTDKVLNENSRVLEINSKTGLYPLYLTYSIYRKRLDKYKREEITFEKEIELWDKTLKENIFVVCKTHMARYITKRTLAGYRKAKVNAHAFDDMINTVTNKQQQFIDKIKRPSYWGIKDKGVKEMKFDAVVGNPPYQVNIDNRGEQPPVYHYFYDLAERLSNIVTLITPARFLFNAGMTPKKWNNKMLNDKHFRIVKCYMKSTDVFPNVDIKGGVAIGLYNCYKDYGAIGKYFSNDILQSIYNKVMPNENNSLSTILYSSTSCTYTKQLDEDFPSMRVRYLKKPKSYVASPDLERYTEVFIEKPNNINNYYGIVGRVNNRRVTRYIKKKYIVEKGNIVNWKVLVPSSNGSGAFGESFSTPMIGQPMIGHNQTFISLGNFNKEDEALNLLKYIKTKFSRAMFGMSKVTQSSSGKEVWASVPIQDFTNNSDIDWSKSISEIDKQLYKKYKLSKEEIDYIEKNVQEMK